MLEIDGLEVFYGNVKVLHGASLRVMQDEIVTLIGPNGAGKTTLLMAVSGVVRPQAGSIRFCGRPIHQLPAHRIVDQGLAQVAQSRHLFPQMSVEENLELGGLRLNARGDTAAALEEVYEIFGVLRERRKQRAGSLSGGEQAMLAFGRALMSRPRLLLLDEPSAGLSPKMVEVLADTIVRLRQLTRLTMLLVEQNAFLALDLADRGYLLESGRIVASGSTEELVGSDKVRVAYLGM